MMVSLWASNLLIASSLGIGVASQPQAAVYRGPAACDGCAEAVGQLLTTSSLHFNVTFVGPEEVVDINEKTLAQMDIYAQPGGGEVEDAWTDVEKYADAIKGFVANGGRYLGFCVGAYLAGHDPGLGLLLQSDDAGEEIVQPRAQVTNETDTIININWTFSTGDQSTKTEQNRWVYFQDGAFMTIADSPTSKVLARYSSNGDIAASLTAYEKGWVGLVGPHVEATVDWYTDNNFTNPEGVKFDLGYDFVETTYKGLSPQPVQSRSSNSKTLLDKSRMIELSGLGSLLMICLMF